MGSFQGGQPLSAGRAGGSWAHSQGWGEIRVQVPPAPRAQGLCPLCSLSVFMAQESMHVSMSVTTWIRPQTPPDGQSDLLRGHTVILGCRDPSAHRKSRPQPASLLMLSGDCHAPPSGSLSPPPLPAAPPQLPSQPALPRMGRTALLKATACPAVLQTSLPAPPPGAFPGSPLLPSSLLPGLQLSPSSPLPMPLTLGSERCPIWGHHSRGRIATGALRLRTGWPHGGRAALSTPCTSSSLPVPLSDSSPWPSCLLQKHKLA